MTEPHRGLIDGVDDHSDDPALIGPELHDDYIDAALHLEWTVEDAERYSQAGLDASFANKKTVTRLRAEFTAEFERLRPIAYSDSIHR